MIISHKYKFVFIGLPFSASSAITKDLYDKYEGEVFLRKHALYQDFIRHANEQEKQYFVFAVLRNPMDMVVTQYVKMKNNTMGNFTNPALFKENGGHITKRHRAKFNFIHKNNASFQQFFLRFYNKPYDNLSSITLDNCDFVIRHENIEKDYFVVLNKLGIKNPTPLPIINKTIGKKEDLSFYYTKEIQKKAVFIFGPFMKAFGYNFPNSWNNVRVRLRDRIYFSILRRIRRINELFIKKHSDRHSLPETMYGQMQRKSKKPSIKK